MSAVDSFHDVLVQRASFSHIRLLCVLFVGSIVKKHFSPLVVLTYILHALSQLQFSTRWLSVKQPIQCRFTPYFTNIYFLP